MSLGYDSAALIPIGPARQKGATVICGYINRGYVTKAYIDQVFASGAVFLPILETDGTPGDNDKVAERGDYDDGARQGQNAINDLRRLGYPDLGCAFTDDVSNSPYPEVKIWCEGIRSTFPNHIVFYGPGHHGDQLVDEGKVDSVWLEGALSFTPRGYKGRHFCGVQLDTNGRFRQENVGGVNCDINTFYSTPWTDRASVLVNLPEDEVTPEQIDEIATKAAQKIASSDVHPNLGDVVNELHAATAELKAAADALRTSAESHPNLGDLVNEIHAATAEVKDTIEKAKQ